jgi:aryl-alcohol dehydrogenase-like predicted oxidoreductase
MTNERLDQVAIHRRLDLGINLLDPSDAYGPFTKGTLVEKAIRGPPRPD